MSTTPQHRFACYLEGVRVPCAMAEIHVAVDTPTIASITLVPTPAAFHAPERTLVHLFWHDGGLWRRLFEGEIISKHIEYSGGHRRAVYRCQDTTLYWQQAHRVFYSLAASGQTLEDPSQPDRHAYFLGTSINHRIDTPNPFISVQDVLGEEIFTRLGSLAKGMEYLLEVTAERIRSTYFAYADQRLKLRRRVLVSDSATALQILAKKRPLGGEPNNAYGSIALVDDTQATLWTLVQTLADELHYQITPNPASRYTRATPNHAADTPGRAVQLDQPDDLARGVGYLPEVSFRPEMFFAPPPECNIILPPLVSSFSYNDQQQQAPTRTMVYVPPKQQGTDIGGSYFAPTVLADRFDAINPDHEELLIEEERRRGFIPRFYSMSTASFGTDSRETIAQIVNYKHHRMRYETRSGRGGGPFNPYLAAGMTAVVVDDTFGFVVGELDGYMHAINLEQGTASTAFTLARCRHVAADPDAPWQSADDRARETRAPEGFYADDEIEGRPWYDEAYHDDQIEDTLYRPLLACRSLKRPDETLPAALLRTRRAFQQAAGAPAQAAHVRRLHHREIATLCESFLYIGAQPVLSADDQKAFGQRNLNEQEDFAAVRALEAHAFINPGGTRLTALDAADPRGPFLADAQDWVAAYRRQAVQKGYAL